MSQPINLAIVGTGIFATDNHLPTIQKIPGLKPYAAYNRTKSKAETFAQKANIALDKVYDSLKKFLKIKTSSLSMPCYQCNLMSTQLNSL